MSIVTAPLDNERPQLGAFAFGTVLLDARRGGRAHHVSLPSLTEDLWRSMNLLKLPMVKQLAREQRVEAELQRDMAALYHRKFVAIQPEVRRAATIIDQLQRSSSRINVHISTPKDGLFGADTGIRRLFSPSVTLNLVTLPKPIRASHTAEYEECGDLSGNQVAMAVLAHLLSMARGAGHTNADQKHEKLKPAATYRQGGKRAPERALEMEWAHLWTEMGHSPFLKAICLLVAPPFALFLAGEELKSSGERILTSLKGDPSTALLRAKRRLLKPLKEEFSWEPVSLESIPLFVENCVLMNAGGLEATLEKADPYETLPLDTIAWSLKGEFANEWLFDFVSEFCKAFGGRTSRWVAETRVFQNNRRGLDVRFAIPSSENLQGLGAALRNATTSEQDCVFPKPSALRTGGEGDVIEPIAVLLSRAPAHADHGEHANFYKGGSELSLTYRSFTLTITPQGFQIVERAEQEQEGEDG